MWPRSAPTTLYQPLKDEDEDEANPSPSHNISAVHRSNFNLWETAPIPKHLLMSGANQLKQEHLLGGGNPIKREQLLGGSNPIQGHLLLTGRESEQTAEFKAGVEEEEGLLSFDHVEDGIRSGQATRQRPRQISFGKAVMLGIATVAVISLATVAFVVTH